MANPLKKGVVMSVLVLDLLIDELTKQLGDRQFYTIRDLKTIGVFGTAQSARKALKNGELAYVKISPRRCVIPRAALLEYLRNNLSEVG